MEHVVELMQKPAPRHVMDGLCQRLKEIETYESLEEDCKQKPGEGVSIKNRGVNGALLADECRKYIYSQDEILWMHVLMTAYYINGGVLLREAHRPLPSIAPVGIAETKDLKLDGISHNAEKTLHDAACIAATASKAKEQMAKKQVAKEVAKEVTKEVTKEVVTREVVTREVAKDTAKDMVKDMAKDGLVAVNGSGNTGRVTPAMEIQVPEMLEMEEMIRSMNM